VQTGAVVDLETHPFKFYLDFGIRVTVNTDNRLITDTTVTKELGLLARQFNLTFADVNNILIAGFKSAFLTFHDRAHLVRRVQTEIADIAARFAARQHVEKGQAGAKTVAPGTTARA
jgi:adenosine deaminase